MPTNLYRLLTIDFNGGSGNVKKKDQAGSAIDGIASYDSSLSSLYATLGASDIYIHHISNEIMGSSLS